MHIQFERGKPPETPNAPSLTYVLMFVQGMCTTTSAIEFSGRILLTTSGLQVFREGFSLGSADGPRDMVEDTHMAQVSRTFVSYRYTCTDMHTKGVC
jgi:hypothetical protein